MSTALPLPPSPLSGTVTLTREVLPPEADGRHDWRKNVITASDLQHRVFPPVSFVVPGLLTEGVTLLASKPKVGKSWLGLDIAIAVTSDRFTLGDIKPSQGDVLALFLEDSPRRIKGRMSKLLQSQDRAWPERLKLATQWRNMAQGGIDDLEEWCKSVERPTLIIIDTLAKIRPTRQYGEQPYDADYAAIVALQRLAIRYSVAILVLHHLRKMGADDVIDVVSGTHGLTGASDTVLVIERRSGGFVLHARSRDIEESEKAIQFNKDTCRWTIVGDAVDVVRSQERVRIIEVLEEADGPLSTATIVGAMAGTKRHATDQMLSRMVQSGEITRTSRGHYTLPERA